MRVVALLALLATTAAAQLPPITTIGRKVEVTAPRVLRRPVVGRLERIAPESLGVLVTRGNTSVVVPMSAITRLRFSRGLDRARGARIGALVGLGAGAVFFASTYPEVRDQDVFGLGFLVLGFTSFVITPGIGAAIGFIVAPEGWEEHRVTPSPADTARLRINFGVGEHVRVKTDAGSYSGTVSNQTENAFSVTEDGRAYPVAWRDVSEVRVRGGKDRVRGAIYGALLGIGVGILGEQSAPTTSTGERIGAFAGSAIVFGFLGSRFLAPRGWTPLPLPATP